MVLKLLVCVTALLASCSHALTTPSPAVGPAKPVEWYAVNLDAAPKDRWTEVLQAKKDDTLAVLATITSQIPAHLLPYLEKVLDFAEHFWPLQIREELQGAAATLGVDAGLLLAMNLYYELNSGCTSVVAQHEVS